MHQFQTTVSSRVSYTGIGLHSGRDVTITLRPAPVDSGIVFVRTDLPGLPSVAAIASNVTATMRATTLESGTAKVFTVEHLLAAFYAMGIDNCFVDITAVEPPVGDGSSLPFIRLLEQAGTVCQESRRSETIIQEAIAVRQDNKFITILPYDGLRITFTSVNSHPQIGVQFGDYEINAESFSREIAAARTIGFMHEVQALQAQGLALGGSLDNAVVYDDEKALNLLRFPDELVRHKILDIVGDLFLAGRVRGHVIAVQSSHALNTELAKKIWARRCLNQ